MRLQQMIFVAFASTVLLIGCHETPNVVASSEVTPIMNIQSQMNLDETVKPLSLTQDMTLMQHVKYIKEEIKHVVLQFTQSFSSVQMKTVFQSLQDMIDSQIAFMNDSSYSFMRLIACEDFYPSSYKGIESYIYKQKCIS
ncbi:MAG: hypothetical protein ACLTXC_10645 [Turicibacter sp.]